MLLVLSMFIITTGNVESGYGKESDVLYGFCMNIMTMIENIVLFGYGSLVYEL